MIRSSCLCGDVTWEIDTPLELMSHCHCSRCRKTHGVAFATYAAVAESGLRLDGRESITRWESSPGFERCFCRRCGSVVPGNPIDGRFFVPAGNLHDDPGVRPLAHIFVGSKAPWWEIRDSLPQFEAYPEGFDAPVIPDRPVPPSTDGVRGSCLCGGVTYVVEGEPVRSHNCHCTRCRKGRSAAHATNLVMPADGVRFTRGQDLLLSYKVPDARFFTQAFCRTCGSPEPHIDRDRGLAVVPMGGLDDAPPMRPQSHIFVASKAPWYEIPDDLPRHAERLA